MIEVKSLSKRYPGGTTPAVDNVSFTVPTGSLFTLLGPSGCGKTTTLRCIAGLEKPDSGQISLFDETVYSSVTGRFVQPSKRRVGMVFQSYAIWPHMTVLQNVAYPLKGNRLTAAETSRRAMDALRLVNLEGLEQRPAPRLSGGQQQRVALARALASDPRIFLFDEPLSNLDAKLRHEMRGQIRSLQRTLGITSLYVTHDQTEALSISDMIAIMDGGKIIELGTPRDVYLNPKTEFAAQFVGQTNIIEGQIRGREPSGHTVIDLPFGALTCNHEAARAQPVGARVAALLRPEQITIAKPTGQAAINQWNGKVVSSEFLGECTEVVVECGNLQLSVKDNGFNHFQDGTDVALMVSPDRFSIIV